MTGNIRNISIYRLAFPIFIQRLLSMCLGYVDTAMISNYSQVAVGAIGNANQVLTFLTLAFSIISTATGVVVAQYLGAKQEKEMDKIYSVSIFFNLMLSFIICLFITLFAGKILTFMRLPTIMLNDAVSYMKIVCFFLFTNALIQVFSQIFNCNGRTDLGMIIFFCMNVFNITGNYMFLYGPLSYLHLGINGVALSTSISNTAGLAAAVIAFKIIIKGNISAKYFFPFPKQLLKQLIKLGVPSAGETISYNLSQICIMVFVNMLGPVAINTKIYCNILCNFAMIYSNSLAGANSIITGYSVGRDDYDFAYKRVLKTLRLAIIVSCGFAFINWLVSPLTFRLFTDNRDIITLGCKIMFIGFWLEFGRAANLVIIQSMRAAGDVVFPTLLGIISMWGISVVFAWLFTSAFDLGLQGVWIAMAMDEIFRGIAVYIRWRHGTWKGKGLVKKESPAAI